jgi:Calcineurin-like phosphoesterase
MSFDVIGDVHGQYDKLVSLLRYLGYRERSGTWRHTDRTAIFVGDLIDRGPQQLATVDVVRRMVAAGTAQCLIGNHELNAVLWFTPDPHLPGEYMRRHARPGNFNQHRAFLEEVAGTPRHAELIDWFKTLPLWLDLGAVRVVHACWHQPSMDLLRPRLGPGTTLSEDVILNGNQRGNPATDALEVLCKGPGVTLPAGMSFEDKDGKSRDEVRIKWWKSDLRTYRDAAILPPGNAASVPDLALPVDAQTYAYSGAPVVFGHYWLSGPPAVISPRFACIDYSAAKAGPLVAYRWEGEAELRDGNMAWVR